MALLTPNQNPEAHEGASALGLAPLKGFRKDVQALRGLAVLAVVLYHSGVALPGGFVGVDVFFVISGFVIGRILVAQLISRGKMSLTTFYVRRARRLLPALGTLLCVVVLLSPLLAPIGGRVAAFKTAIATALFGANVYLYRATEGGYFADAADLNPLLHTWSLSVEEQFYLVMPAMLLVAWRIGRRRPLAGLRVAVIGIIVLSFAACAVFSYGGDIGPLNGGRFAFFSPFTRAWEFAAGVGLVLLPVRWLPSRRTRPIVIAAGLAMIAAAALALIDLTPFPGSVALLPVLGATLVIYGQTSSLGVDLGGGATSLLRPMIFLGDVSYSLYLWHWPLVVYAGAFWPASGTLPRALAAALSLLPAWLSHRFIEQRFRMQRSPRARPALALAAACVLVPLAAATIVLPLRSTIGESAEVGAFDRSRLLHADETAGCSNPSPLGDRPEGTCSWGNSDSTTSIVLVGDSNAGQFSESFIGAAEERGLDLRIATMSACPFIDAIVIDEERQNFACRRFVLRSIDHLVDDAPELVVIANATDFYLTSERYELVDVGSDVTTQASRSQVFAAGLERAIGRLRAAGISVAVINVIPKPEDWNPADCSALAALVDTDRCLFPDFSVDDAPTQVTARRLEADVAQRADARLWSFEAQICPAGRCVAMRDGTLVWRDGQHVTVSTSRALADPVEREVAGSL